MQIKIYMQQHDYRISTKNRSSCLLQEHYLLFLTLGWFSGVQRDAHPLGSQWHRLGTLNISIQNVTSEAETHLNHTLCTGLVYLCGG